MPDILRSYTFSDIAAGDLYGECSSSLKDVGGTDFQQITEQSDPSVKGLASVIPSSWGWGGMKLSFRVYTQDKLLKMDLKGYIAQMGVTPLTKKMDSFLKNLSTNLNAKYNYSFQYEPFTKFLPTYKLQINKDDKKVFILILVSTLVAGVAGLLFGHAAESLISVLTLGLGYYFGKKFLHRKP